jgi:acyl-CoA reductase-like NAD-dependent aldehyde dehydrogenase
MTDDARLPVPKTYKLYIGGAFPRSESGRSEVIRSSGGAVLGHSCRASRKDLREAVSAARKALPGWSGATAYNRGQVLYRLAEMLEGKLPELAGLLEDAPAGAAMAPAAEVAAAIDLLVCFAGWADKHAQVLGCQNPVAGPYWNITVPEPTGVVGVVPPASPGLLGMVALVAPALVSGNTAVVVAEGFAPVVSSLGEAAATSDLPAGVLNLLTGQRAELVPVLAQHRDVDAIVADGLPPELARAVREGVADNLKRVTLGQRAPEQWADARGLSGPESIAPFVEFKTVWHPVGT